MILELEYFKFFFKKGFNYFVKMFNNKSKSLNLLLNRR